MSAATRNLGSKTRELNKRMESAWSAALLKVMAGRYEQQPTLADIRHAEQDPAYRDSLSARAAHCDAASLSRPTVL